MMIAEFASGFDVLHHPTFREIQVTTIFSLLSLVLLIDSIIEIKVHIVTAAIIKLLFLASLHFPHENLSVLEYASPHLTPYRSHTSHKAPAFPWIHKSFPVSHPPLQFMGAD